MPQATRGSPAAFVVLVFGVSLPLWLLSALAPGLGAGLPADLPASALMFVAPLVAAVALTRRERHTGGVADLLRRVADHGRIPGWGWYVPIVVLAPAVMVLSYAVLVLAGRPLPAPDIALASVPVLVLVYGVAAACEELGWMGYAGDALLARWSALVTAVALGAAWAVWHVVPWLQAGHGWRWIAGQAAYTVALRIMIVWIYVNTRRSVLAATLAHAVSNVSWTLFPDGGSHYDPVVSGAILALAAALTVAWGGRSLRRGR